MKTNKPITHDGQTYEHLIAKARINAGSNGSLSIIGTLVPAKINENGTSEELADCQIPLRIGNSNPAPEEIELAQDLQRAFQKYIDRKQI